MSSGFDPDIKLRIKEANPIQDLVESYVPLRRQGSIYVANCPWHDDRKPSLQINPARQTWVCYVCEIRGDVFDFVMRREAVDFVGALKILAERAGIPLNLHQKRVEKGSPDDKQTLYAAMAWAEQQYHRCLLESADASIAREYLEQRNVSTESIETFRVGFAPAKWSWLVDHARSSDFSPKVLEACGLISQNERAASWYERFRGRVLFPIRDTMQRAIGLGGRVVPGVFPEDQTPPAKYINSPETRLYSKSENLYGLNVIRDEVAKSKNRKLTLVEGYTDVIAAWQAGLRNVAAVLGTALNERHIRLIKRFADQITLVLDGDAAGQRRTNEILDIFVANDIDLRILSLPEGVDPFDYLMQHGGEAFQELVSSAPDAIAHKIRIETEGIDLARDTHQATQALTRILETLARLPVSIFTGSTANLLRQDQILARLARKFQLDRDQIRTG